MTMSDPPHDPPEDVPPPPARLEPVAPSEPAGRTIAPLDGIEPPDADLPGRTIAPADFDEDQDPVPDVAPKTRPAPTPRPAPAQAAPPAQGGRLGRWILDRELGHGTTATVWAAHHEQLGAPVAIKVFHRKDLPFQAILGEAQAAAGIPSPHVVWVHDVDVLDGHPCIVMEMVGTSDRPAHSLRENPPEDDRQAARWIADAARGVAAAHEVGVFHKDIKPPNILLGPLDQRARISDFGLANPLLFRRPPTVRRKAQETIALALDEVRLELAMAGEDPCAAIRGTMRLGTPEFMAPEQAAGLRRDLDPDDPVHRFHLQAIDVYGLGATLWCLLVGRPPFPRDGTDPERVDAADIMDEIVAHPAPSLAQEAPRVPAGLRAIVERAMHHDPRARHPSAGALADDLEAWLATRPTSLDTTAWQRGLVHLRRERATVRMMGLLAVVTLASFGIVWNNVQRIEAQQAEMAALASQVEAERATVASERQQKGEIAEDLATTAAELEARTKSLQSNRRRLNAASSELDDLRAKQSATAESLSSVKTLLSETEAVLSQTTTALTEAEAAREAAQARIDALEIDLGATRAERDAQRVRADDGDATIERLEEDQERLTAVRDQLTRQVDTLRADRAALQAQVAAAQDAAAAAEARSVQVRKQLDYYRAEHARLVALLGGTEAPSDPGTTTPAPERPVPTRVPPSRPTTP